MVNFPLSPEQIDEYREDGVLLLPSLLDEQTVKSLNETIDALVEDALARGDETILELEPELQLEPEPPPRAPLGWGLSGQAGGGGSAARGPGARRGGAAGR